VVQLKYSDNRLLFGVFNLACAVAYLIFSFLHPLHPGRGAGSLILVPAMAVGLSALALRLLALSTATPMAVETSEEGVLVTGLWGGGLIRWDDFVRAEAHWIRFGLMRGGWLSVQGTRRKVSIPLAFVSLTRKEATALARQLMEMRNRTSVATAALSRPVGGGSGASDDSDFDAEAALARYLARKEGGAGPPPAAAAVEDEDCGGDFDAEAALNRYLARKHGAAPAAAHAPTPPAAPAAAAHAPPAGFGAPRPVFGRKAV
jgi:hypothetical protein